MTPPIPETDSSTRPLAEMELFVREQYADERDFKIAYRMGPNASAGVAEVYGSNVGISPEVAEAIAYRIVRAFNNHDALLEALEEAQRILHGDNCQVEDGCVEACIGARDAIAQAQS